jgi:hypothetical protein
MINTTDIQTKFIRRFIKKDKQDRYLGFLLNQKNRYKFLSELSHFKDFIAANFDLLNKTEKEILFNKIKNNKITNDCYIISDNHDFDNKTMDFKDAINNAVGYGFGVILIFGDADIVYYEGEDERLISK